jgi:hypothetical protein
MLNECGMECAVSKSHITFVCLFEEGAECEARWVGVGWQFGGLVGGWSGRDSLMSKFVDKSPLTTIMISSFSIENQSFPHWHHLHGLVFPSRSPPRSVIHLDSFHMPSLYFTLLYSLHFLPKFRRWNEIDILHIHIRIHIHIHIHALKFIRLNIQTKITSTPNLYKLDLAISTMSSDADK